MKKYILFFLLFCLLATVFAGFHNQLTLTEYTLSNPRVPSSFDCYRIAVVSDLHAERFGNEQEELNEMLRNSGCDLICLLGDMVSSDTTDFSPVWEFVDAFDHVPILYVAGNNELSLDHYDIFLKDLESRGVIILDEFTQNTFSLNHGDESILIHGYPFVNYRRLSDRLPVAPSGYFNIMLYHDPYCFPEVALLDYDLMLSGHMHGGVIRIPFLGSPIERFGIEPFTKGLYTDHASSLIVSGGLGDHETLPRFFNSPEIVLITLKSEN